MTRHDYPIDDATPCPPPWLDPNKPSHAAGADLLLAERDRRNAALRAPHHASGGAVLWAAILIALIMTGAAGYLVATAIAAAARFLASIAVGG